MSHRIELEKSFYLDDKYEQILNRMLSVNPQIEHVKLNMVNSHGYADHCLYSPQCSDQLLLEATKFYADILEKQRTL